MNKYKVRLEMTQKVEDFSFLGIVDPLDPTSINRAIRARIETFEFTIPYNLGRRNSLEIAAPHTQHKTVTELEDCLAQVDVEGKEEKKL